MPASIGARSITANTTADHINKAYAAHDYADHGRAMAVLADRLHDRTRELALRARSGPALLGREVHTNPKIYRGHLYYNLSKAWGYASPKCTLNSIAILLESCTEAMHLSHAIYTHS